MKHGIDNLVFECFTDEAKEWYSPLKPYTLLEYQWVRDNLKLTNETIVIDAGCHHGNYSVVFKPAFVIAIDINQEYLDYAAMNMASNEMDFMIICKKLGENGVRTDFPIDIYKIDIEGDEFKLLPNEIDLFPHVHTWIVEVHPKYGNPEIIAKYFLDRKFSLLKVDRDTMRIREYIENEKWNGHATLIARKITR